MTSDIHYQNDSSLQPLEGKRVAVLGYGSQGRAHALNLRDSGCDVVVGLREHSPSAARVRDDHLVLAECGKACADADLIAVLVPDQHQAAVYDQAVEPNLKPGTTLLFAHGFNIHFGQVEPPTSIDVVLVAPKAPGPLVRRTFVEGMGVPALAAVHQDASGQAWARTLAYACAIGCGRAGVIETTFAEETETDLFGEQAVLCGGLSRVVQLGFETLVEAGYQPEIAYFECLHELKLIVDLLYEGGFTHMRAAVSDTAEFGDLTRGELVIGDGVKQAMQQILADIVDGSFAREWIREAGSGEAVLESARRRQSQLKIEEVGRSLREMMPWVGTASKELAL